MTLYFPLVGVTKLVSQSVFWQVQLNHPCPTNSSNVSLPSWSRSLAANRLAIPSLKVKEVCILNFRIETKFNIELIEIKAELVNCTSWFLWLLRRPPRRLKARGYYQNCRRFPVNHLWGNLPLSSPAQGLKQGEVVLSKIFSDPLWKIFERL